MLTPILHHKRLHMCTAPCRLADAYKTPETDRLSKVDYRRFCDDINTGELGYTSAVWMLYQQSSHKT